MAFLGDEDLKVLIESSSLIEPYCENRIQSGSYELSLGYEYFSTGKDSKVSKHLSDLNRHLVIEPGQFALLLTYEKIVIPNDKIAFISIKAGIKFKGLVNISGFHVDPGFRGKLKFSVYNAGPAPIVLEALKPCFIIWFSDLTNNLSSSDLYNGSHQDQTNITVDDLTKLQGELASPGVLLQMIEKLEARVKLFATATSALLLIIVTSYFTPIFTAEKNNSSQRATLDSISHKNDKRFLELMSRFDSLKNSNLYKKPSVR